MPHSGSRPAPHPLPPPSLAYTDLPIRIIDQFWFRFHGVLRPAIYWGRTPPRPFPLRFDSPGGASGDADYGVLYAAADEHGAFIETFGHNTGVRRIGTADLRSRYLSRIDVSRPLRLVDLTGSRLAQLGVDARLFTGDYGISQHWSRAFYEHDSAPDGIYYPSRHDNERMCAALFDRVEAHVTSACLGTLADTAQIPLLRDLLDTYQFGLGRS